MTHGAVAITLSGGYVDNDDSGETFTYAGAGGQDKAKKQVGATDVVVMKRMIGLRCRQGGMLPGPE